MVLTERDRNMAPGGKRPYEVIDLTEDEPPTKIQKNAAAFNAQHRPNPIQQDRSNAGYPTPPASSAPRWSQDSYRSSFGYPAASTQVHSLAERESWLAADDDEDDYNDTIASTQAAAVNFDQLHHYGDVPTKIVGVQYYRGNASVGEQILMKREPGNPYDKNAIRIDNMANNQIGHIPRRIAEKLSKFIDHGFLHVEGQLAGHVGQFDCPLSVSMYGPDPQSEEGASLRAEMQAAKLPLNGLKAAEKAEKERKKEAEKQRKEDQRRIAEARKAAAIAGTGHGGRLENTNQYGWTNQSQAGPSAQPVMADILEASQRFNPREIGQATDQYGVKEDLLKNMPLTEQPKGVRTQMLPYQLQALKWLLDQESPRLPPPASKDAVQLWKRNERQGGLFMNLATSFSTQEPALARGGVLADDMGLGKTLQMIALIAADKERNGATGPTLIVAPLSVLSNWKVQVATHCDPNNGLDVYVHHGASRLSTPAELQQHDIIVTTYQTLATDYMPKAKGSGSKQPEHKLRSSGLYSVNWHRVILDEGHVIRNPISKVAGAVTALMSRSKWALTGTPIVNSLKDLYSLLRFIGISGGLQDLEIFNRVLVRPLKLGDPGATSLLQPIMTAFTLRRRKDMAYIDLKLPKLEEFVHRIDFTSKERERYDALSQEAQGLLQRYEKKAGQHGQGASQAYQHLLEILLRMRQCCNHFHLCKERITSLLAQLEEQKTVDLTPENKKALQDILQLRIESQEDCAICLEMLHTPVITTCGHSFGQECISKVIETQKKCPMCRAELQDESCLVQAANDCGDDAADDEMDLTQSSSKIEAMMEILSATKAENGKTVIFSQWTRFLDIVQARLDRDGYKHCRIDGTMAATKRDAALQALDQDPKTTVMLASLGVCAVGLNLTAANQVILSDTWWAPAIEDQAVDRVHRLGQKRQCRVFRLVIDKSIEEQTIQVQKDKRALAQLAFSEKAGKRENARNSRLADIQRLLRPTKDETADVKV